MRIVAGERYLAAGGLLGWLVLAQAFRGMYYMATGYVFYCKKTGVVSRITIVSGLINVCLLYFMVKEFGLVGAAWAACISMAYQWLATWRASRALVAMPWRLTL